MTHSRECPHVYPYYDPEKSSTASFQTCFNKCSFCRKGICVIGTEYKDGSFARGLFERDLFLGSLAAINWFYYSWSRVWHYNYRKHFYASIFRSDLWDGWQIFKWSTRKFVSAYSALLLLIATTVFQIDGLWGMGFASQAQVTPVFDSFVQQGIQNMFSMCFSTHHIICAYHTCHLATYISQMTKVACFYWVR